MNRPFSRRQFAQAALALPALGSALHLESALAQVASGGPLSAAIGSTKASFDADYGASRQEGNYTVYDFTSSGQAAYWMLFDKNGHAEYIEVDLTSLPGGGIEANPDTIGTSRFVPADAADGGVWAWAGNRTISGTIFGSRVYYSAQLAAVTGRSGWVLVMDEIWKEGYINAPPLRNLRTFVALETYEVNPIVGTGTRPTTDDTDDEWSAFYGPLQAAQNGSFVPNPPFDGDWQVDTIDGALVNYMDINLATHMRASEAAGFISEVLRAGLEPMTTFWLPPSPNGNIGLRVHTFNTYRYEYVTSIQYVHDGEQNGTVSRIMIVHSTNLWF